MNQDYREVPSLTGDLSMTYINKFPSPEVLALQYLIEQACRNLNMNNQLYIQQKTSHAAHAGRSIDILSVPSFYQGIGFSSLNINVSIWSSKVIVFLP